MFDSDYLFMRNEPYIGSSAFLVLVALFALLCVSALEPRNVFAEELVEMEAANEPVPEESASDEPSAPKIITLKGLGKDFGIYIAPGTILYDAPSTRSDRSLKRRHVGDIEVLGLVNGGWVAVRVISSGQVRYVTGASAVRYQIVEKPDVVMPVKKKKKRKKDEDMAQVVTGKRSLGIGLGAGFTMDTSNKTFGVMLVVRPSSRFTIEATGGAGTYLDLHGRFLVFLDNDGSFDPYIGGGYSRVKDEDSAVDVWEEGATAIAGFEHNVADNVAFRFEYVRSFIDSPDYNENIFRMGFVFFTK